MKALTLTFALLLICTGAALAQTPDGETPAEEMVCDSENGAAFGLCNAYCEAMDCESDSPQASETACTRVRDKFMNIAGHDLPCEAPPGCLTPPPGTTCPCVGDVQFDGALADPDFLCSDLGTAIELSGNGTINAECTPSPGCGVLDGISLSITPEQGSACVQLIREACTP